MLASKGRYTQAMSIQTLASREVYRNRWMRVREDEIERSNGARGIYGVVEKHPCAVIIPLAGDTLYLIQQYRYTVGEVCLEFPQGGWEDPDVDIHELARGELREETGLRAATLHYLGPMWVAYGFCNQQQHAFLATDLTPGETDFDPEEHDLTLHPTPVAEFERLVLAGRIKDCCTLAAWGLYKVWSANHSKQGA